MPDLTDEMLREIEQRSLKPVMTDMHGVEYVQFVWLAPAERDALCAEVRRLRGENARAIGTEVALRSQAKASAERIQIAETSMCPACREKYYSGIEARIEDERDQT